MKSKDKTDRRKKEREKKNNMLRKKKKGKENYEWRMLANSKGGRKGTPDFANEV